MAHQRKTPLYDWHRDHGARIVDYHGWLMPIEYGEITEEVQQTRTAAGLFDVSHMGQILVEGSQAPAFLDRMLTADLSNLEKGTVRYSPMCNHQGGTVDDVLVYMLENERYLVVVNAANKEKDHRWLLDHAEKGASIEDLSGEYAQLALQGPYSQDLMEQAASSELDLSGLKPFTFLPRLAIGGVECLVSRTGYTGEDGFELYCSNRDVLPLWKALLKAGKSGHSAAPIGLGARDILRLEASLPLYGHELDEDITPLEAGLERFVALHKETPFNGQKALLEQKTKGVNRSLRGVEMRKRGVPRSGYPIQKDEEEVGYISSGTHSPTLEIGIGMAFLDPRKIHREEEVDVLIRGRPRPARVVKLPFYRREKK